MGFMTVSPSGGEFKVYVGYNAKAGFPLVGTQAGWDMKRVIGTATVEPDGSAFLQIPANVPVSIQPLDSEGRAVQLQAPVGLWRAPPARPEPDPGPRVRAGFPHPIFEPSETEQWRRRWKPWE